MLCMSNVFVVHAPRVLPNKQGFKRSLVSKTMCSIAYNTLQFTFLFGCVCGCVRATGGPTTGPTLPLWPCSQSFHRSLSAMLTPKG